MADSYSRSAVRLAVGQICKSLGWESIQSSSLDILEDLMERYMKSLGKNSRLYADHCDRANVELQDVSMAFLETGTNPLELAEYIKAIEPLSIGQPVANYPVKTEDKLIYPEYYEKDEDGETTFHINHNINLTNAATSEDILNSPATYSTQPEISPSPARINSRIKLNFGDSDRLHKSVCSEEQKDQGDDLDSLLRAGRAPTSRKPRGPSVIGVNVPKSEVKVSRQQSHEQKPPPVHIKMEKPVKKEREPPAPKPPSRSEMRHKQRAERKKQKKKQTAPPAAPGGFNDIFGETLQPTVNVSKPKLTVKPEKRVITPEIVATSGSDSDDEQLTIADPDTTHEHWPPARMERVDDTIESVLSASREDIEKDEMADEAFQFDDRPVTPVESRMPPLKTKKIKNSPLLSSPVYTPDYTQEFNQEYNQDSDEFQLSLSPPAPKKPKTKSKKDKSERRKHKSALEAFASAPIEEITVSKQPVISDTDSSVGEPEDMIPPPPKSTRQSSNRVMKTPDITKPFSIKHRTPEDDESALVNVDGSDSDIDVMGGDSSPPPINPFAAAPPIRRESPPKAPSLTPEPCESPTSVLDIANIPSSPDKSEPTAQRTDSRTTSRAAEDEWEVYNSNNEEETIHWDEDAHGSTSTTVLTSYAQPNLLPQLPNKTKKDKHKKEKKEKKEKKKKKSKDRDRESSVHSDLSNHATHHKKQKKDDELPKLTFKFGKEPQPEPEESFPKLLIKPIAQIKPICREEPVPVAAAVVEDAVAVDDAAAGDDKIWICPTCQKPDDGSPMIGCDTCDEWFHWPCVKVLAQPPEDVPWYCPTCLKKDKGKKRRRKKDKR